MSAWDTLETLNEHSATYFVRNGEIFLCLHSNGFVGNGGDIVNVTGFSYGELLVCLGIGTANGDREP